MSVNQSSVHKLVAQTKRLILLFLIVALMPMAANASSSLKQLGIDKETGLVFRYVELSKWQMADGVSFPIVVNTPGKYVDVRQDGSFYIFKKTFKKYTPAKCGNLDEAASVNWRLDLTEDFLKYSYVLDGKVIGEYVGRILKSGDKYYAAYGNIDFVNGEKHRVIGCAQEDGGFTVTHDVVEVSDEGKEYLSYAKDATSKSGSNSIEYSKRLLAKPNVKKNDQTYISRYNKWIGINNSICTVGREEFALAGKWFEEPTYFKSDGSPVDAYDIYGNKYKFPFRERTYTSDFNPLSSNVYVETDLEFVEHELKSDFSGKTFGPFNFIVTDLYNSNENYTYFGKTKKDHIIKYMINGNLLAEFKGILNIDKSKV